MKLRSPLGGPGPLSLVLVPVLVLLLAPCPSHGRTAGRSAHHIKLARLERWVRTGFQHLKVTQCRRGSPLSEGECKRLSRLQLSSVAVYASEPVTHHGAPDKVVAILPDSHHAMTGSSILPDSHHAMTGSSILPDSHHAMTGSSILPDSHHAMTGSSILPDSHHAMTGSSILPDSHHTMTGTSILPDSHHAMTGTPILPDSHHAMTGTSKLAPRYGMASVLDDVLPGAMAHDAVLVLDPSPRDNFGHPVVLFYVDMNVTKKRCSHMDGVYSGEECLTLALKSRCQNQLKRRPAVPERLLGNMRGRVPSMALLGNMRGTGLCEVHFLPLVTGLRDASRTQRLRCVESPEFGLCPRPLASSPPSMSSSSCELSHNTRRCHQQPVATQRSCRLYQTCDHALLLSGGWQPQILYPLHLQNLLSFYGMLRNNGFHKDHIKTFFSGSGQLPEGVEGVFPATEKSVIRQHLSYICRRQHCADSLVLYLNSPTRSDGTMLLWDANLNGIAEVKEVYTASELLLDLARCRASRVLLFVEQSYSTVLAKRLRGSSKHRNVVLIHVPARHDPNQDQDQDQDQAWVEGYWTNLTPRTCLVDHLARGPGTGTARLLATWATLLNVTLAGAPCDATPPLTDSELRKKYHACQNLPTAVWYQNHPRT